MAKPNLLFLMPDQLRPDFLGCSGASFIDTPQIDALAAHGVRFTRAYSGCGRFVQNHAKEHHPGGRVLVASALCRHAIRDHLYRRLRGGEDGVQGPLPADGCSAVPGVAPYPTGSPGRRRRTANRIGAGRHRSAQLAAPSRARLAS